MDRVISYPGQIPLVEDFLQTNKNVMLALGYLAQAAVGVGPIASGLEVTQTVSPGLSVLIAPGSMYKLDVVDNTAYSQIALDTANSVVKQGFLAAAATLGPVTKPSASNRQICIVQAKLVEQDTDLTVLPYYNSANANQALNGPGNAGTSQARTRQVALQLSFKYGTATTGTPTRPSLDTGAVGLCEFELVSTTTQITAAAQSSSNSQIKQYGGAGDPRVKGPFASLVQDNAFSGSQSIGGALTVIGAITTATAAANAGEVPNIGQFSAGAGTFQANQGSIKIPTSLGTLIVKWGFTSFSASGAATAVTFTTAFPTAIWGILCTPAVTGTTQHTSWVDSPAVGGFNGHTNGTAAVGNYWLAWGI